jgi:hypothetical protein
MLFRFSRLLMLIPLLAIASTTLAAGAVVHPQAAIRSEAAALTVEEYELVPDAEDSPDHIEFKDHVPSSVLDVRRAWREPPPAERLERINAVIGAWDYELRLNTTATTRPTYTLLYQDNPLVTDVTKIWPLAVNASETAFQLLLDSESQPTLVATQNTVGKLDKTGFAYFAPVYVGDDLVKVVAAQDEYKFYVERAGERVYTVTPQQQSVLPPVKGLWSWDGHWVLEAEGDIIIDGDSLNDQHGYSESFGWQVIAGEPFYFFRQDDQVRMSYAGEMVKGYHYARVVHYRCCEASIFNARGNRSMVWFYGLRDGMWYYVEAGIYEE